MGRLREAHAGADCGGKADEQCRPCVVCCEGGREDWRERRDRAVHQACETWLDQPQDQLLVRCPVLLGAGVAREMGLLQQISLAFVLALGLCEVAEEPARRGVAYPLSRLVVERQAASSIRSASSRMRSMPRLATSQTGRRLT